MPTGVRAALYGLLSLAAGAGTGVSEGLAGHTEQGMAFTGANVAEPLRAVMNVSVGEAFGVAGLEDVPGRVQVTELDRAWYAALAPMRHADVRLPWGDGAMMLRLERFEVLAPDARLIEVGEQGERVLVQPEVQLWRGSVIGDDGSRAFLAISPLGTHGFVMSAGKRVSISTIAPDANSPLAGRTTIADVEVLDAARRALIAGGRGTLLHQAWSCAGAIMPAGAAPEQPQGLTVRDVRGPGATCRAIRVGIDADQEFTQSLFNGNATTSAAYATTLLGAVSTIYARDVGVALQVSFLRVWTTTDPYSSGNLGDQLTQLRTTWVASPPSTTTNVVHLLSGRYLGGGVAYISTLCDPYWAFGVSSNLAGSFPQPLADNRSGNWDPFVVAHELGHNFSSGHTHEPWAYAPPIDGCGNAYLSPPLAQNCSVGLAQNGTIMSYCHLCGGGQSNIDMTFGPRPSAKITSFLTSNVPNCGVSLAAPAVSPTIAISGSRCPGGTVTLSVSATPQAGETLRFTWYRGTQQVSTVGASLTLTGLSAAQAGSYTCTVSNACQQTTAGPAALVLCTADFNCAGDVSVQDVFDFLSAWFANQPRADVNGAGGVSVQDIFDFVSQWFSGC